MPYFNFYQHCIRAITFNRETFGPHPRQDALRDHVESELREIALEPDVSEWADVAILAIDGLTRATFELVGKGAPIDVVAYLASLALWQAADVKVDRRWDFIEMLKMVPRFDVQHVPSAIRNSMACTDEPIESWLEVLTLAHQGALELGSTVDFVRSIAEKQVVNEFRSWPNWKNSPHKAIFHKKEEVVSFGR